MTYDSLIETEAARLGALATDLSIPVPTCPGWTMADLITHRYEHAAHTLEARVDTTWTARYRVNGGEWRDVGGTVTITGQPYDLAVRSASPALTG